MPRHLGIHSGGVVIIGALLMGRVVTEPATMTDRVVVQRDKAGLQEAGLVKIDLLALRMLSALSDAIKLGETMKGTPADLAHLAFDDPTVYEMISQADTIGVFQEVPLYHPGGRDGNDECGGAAAGCDSN